MPPERRTGRILHYHARVMVTRSGMPARLARLVLVAAALAAAAPIRGQSAGAPLDAPALAREVDGLLQAHGEGVAVSLWLGAATGPAWFAREPSTPRPTASAIKTFYLVELLDAAAGAFDRPLDGVAPVLADDAHPAISHFAPAKRDEIRRELGGASARRIGLVMMGTAPASNEVYNAAANVTTAVLGGPEALSARIHRRDPAFAGVAARRYMLRDRKEHGDNEAPAEALAVLYQKLASGTLTGLDAATLEAIRAASRRADDPVLGRHYAKNGDLASDPLAEVRAGWYETAAGPRVYVVMATQPGPGPGGREASSQRLSRTATALRDALVRASITSRAR
jgi:hypothetical protein